MILIERMKRFLGDYIGRHDFSKFIYTDGFLIATDGRVLIRKFCDKPEGVEFSENFPDPMGLFKGLLSRKETELSSLSWATSLSVPCDWCDGKGKEPLDCGDCGMVMEKECLGDECPMTRDLPCRFCDGKKVIFEDYDLNTKEAIAGKYLTLLSSLDNVVLYIAKPTQPIRFTFDGGDGLVMPKSRG